MKRVEALFSSSSLTAGRDDPDQVSVARRFFPLVTRASRFLTESSTPCLKVPWADETQRWILRDNPTSLWDKLLASPADVEREVGWFLVSATTLKATTSPSEAELEKAWSELKKILARQPDGTHLPGTSLETFVYERAKDAWLEDEEDAMRRSLACKQHYCASVRVLQGWYYFKSPPSIPGFKVAMNREKAYVTETLGAKTRFPGCSDALKEVDRLYHAAQSLNDKSELGQRIGTMGNLKKAVTAAWAEASLTYKAYPPFAPDLNEESIVMAVVEDRVSFETSLCERGVGQMLTGATTGQSKRLVAWVKSTCEKNGRAMRKGREELVNDLCKAQGAPFCDEKFVDCFAKVGKDGGDIASCNDKAKQRGKRYADEQLRCMDLDSAGLKNSCDPKSCADAEKESAECGPLLYDKETCKKAWAKYLEKQGCNSTLVRGGKGAVVKNVSDVEAMLETYEGSTLWRSSAPSVKVAQEKADLACERIAGIRGEDIFSIQEKVDAYARAKGEELPPGASAICKRAVEGFPRTVRTFELFNAMVKAGLGKEGDYDEIDWYPVVKEGVRLIVERHGARGGGRIYDDDDDEEEEDEEGREANWDASVLEVESKATSNIRKQTQLDESYKAGGDRTYRTFVRDRRVNSFFYHLIMEAGGSRGDHPDYFFSKMAFSLLDQDAVSLPEYAVFQEAASKAKKANDGMAMKLMTRFVKKMLVPLVQDARSNFRHPIREGVMQISKALKDTLQKHEWAKNLEAAEATLRKTKFSKVRIAGRKEDTTEGGMDSQEGLLTLAQQAAGLVGAGTIAARIPLAGLSGLAPLLQAGGLGLGALAGGKAYNQGRNAFVKRRNETNGRSADKVDDFMRKANPSVFDAYEAVWTMIIHQVDQGLSPRIVARNCINSIGT